MSLSEKVRRLKRLAAVLVTQRFKLAAGLMAFAALVLPHLLTDPPAPFHYELCAELDRAVEPGRRLIGALPREHAKTTLGTVALVLRELCLGKKRNILLIAANSTEARVKLRQIVDEIETNTILPPAWRARLRPARDRKGQMVAYGDAEIVLAGGARVSVLGFGGKVRGQLSFGRRLDLVVLDDPENDEMVDNPELRRKLRRWVDTALVNSLDVRRGSLVWLGTLLHHDSVLAQWMEHHGDEWEPADMTCGTDTWRVIRRAALDDRESPLWPGRWSRAQLERRKQEIGSRAFDQEFLNRPLSLDTQVFRDADFRLFDPAQLRLADGQWYLADIPLTVAAGVDPAIGEGTRHDYFAACVVGIARPSGYLAAAGNHRNGGERPDEAPLFIYVLDVLKLRARFGEQLDALVALSRRWRPRQIGVENVAYQTALSQAALSRGLPVLGMTESRPKALRIEGAAVHCLKGRVLLPAAAPWVEDFRLEARDYPAGRHDDQLDAFARATEVALSLAPQAGLSIGSSGPRIDPARDKFSGNGKTSWRGF